MILKTPVLLSPNLIPRAIRQWLPLFINTTRILITKCKNCICREKVWTKSLLKGSRTPHLGDWPWRVADENVGPKWALALKVSPYPGKQRQLSAAQYLHFSLSKMCKQQLYSLYPFTSFLPIVSRTWRAPHRPSDFLSQLPTENADREWRISQVLVNFNCLTHLGIFLHITMVELTVAMARPTRTTPKSLGSRNLFPYR